MNDQNTIRYGADDLTGFATALLEKAGLAEDRAQIVAEILVESDLMGHTTHGLQLLPNYIKELENGRMTREGDPGVIRDTGATLCWNGRYLPGPWLMQQAIELTLQRLSNYPVVTVVLREAHHIACLAAYPEKVTRHGYMMLLASSDPANKTVAPFGGLEGVYSPSPIAAGIPTEGDPIIIDISTSSTANGVVIQKHDSGERLPHPWLLDHNGVPTDDPDSFFQEQPATILPLGGTDAGYKGFGLALIVEALTSALAGFGRADEPQRWVSSVFLQVIDPAAFGGKDAFLRETSYLAQACRNSRSRPGASPVRLPGQRGLKLRRQQLKTGVVLHPTIMPKLLECAIAYDVALPQPIAAHNQKK